MGIVLLSVLLVAVALLWASARAAITICVLEVRDGKLRVARGGMASAVLSDIGDVVARPTIERATLRVVRSSGYARLEVNGSVSPSQQQQLRNVIGSVPLAKLRAVQGPRRA